MYSNYHNYEKYPEIRVDGYDAHAFSGYGAIINEIGRLASSEKKTVLVLDFYPGVDEQEILGGFSALRADAVFRAEDCMADRESYQKMIRDNLTDDRVFGILTVQRLEHYFLADKMREMRERIKSVESGIVLLYGMGAALITEGDALVYCDMARWEIQNRFKRGAANYHTDNTDAPFLTKYKQGFFVEWRLADRHKERLFEKIDYLLDTNRENHPVMITGEAFLAALKAAARRPFRLVPYFDPGVWGGQWMKEVCGLSPDKENYAWSFDGVPEENSLFLRFGAARVEIPAMDLVLYQPRALLGERVYARFGAEFPIRFDLLDTMQGQNLSLQVHPLTGYIQRTFGMHYTQDESYYILDCSDDAYVYIGLRENVDAKQMVSDLKDARDNATGFDAEKYVNKLPVKKHDHVLIPAGTVHCSGADTMVLEISATPYIFTFKLWDWGRLGLDGLPRPLHIEHGEQVIQWDRTTPWVNSELVGQTELVREQDGQKTERTGLHRFEFIETVRDTFTKEVLHHTCDSVNVLNLVQGEEAEVYSVQGGFEPFVVHYAETFIIPAAVKEYGIRPTAKSSGQQLMTIKASVR